MKVSRRSRKFHDPWGNKHGNSMGHICHMSFLVGKSESNDVDEHDNDHGHPLSTRIYHFDNVSCREHLYNSYIRAKHAPEKLRR